MGRSQCTGVVEVVAIPECGVVADGGRMPIAVAAVTGTRHVTRIRIGIMDAMQIMAAGQKRTTATTVVTTRPDGRNGDRAVVVWTNAVRGVVAAKGTVNATHGLNVPNGGKNGAKRIVRTEAARRPVHDEVRWAGVLRSAVARSDDEAMKKVVVLVVRGLAVTDRPGAVRVAKTVAPPARMTRTSRNGATTETTCASRQKSPPIRL
ncbi:hypothetical protein [Maioricimonas rarisocia]|uniref:hypothetical protein n=1 Tax=Maioricimonas rarisocia TaxID=2528026 RepID=UPI00119E84DD|nr:hypothetical protein [Maioricimonas rarisocia]